MAERKERREKGAGLKTGATENKTQDAGLKPRRYI